MGINTSKSKINSNGISEIDLLNKENILFTKCVIDCITNMHSGRISLSNHYSYRINLSKSLDRKLIVKTSTIKMPQVHGADIINLKSSDGKEIKEKILMHSIKDRNLVIKLIDNNIHTNIYEIAINFEHPSRLPRKLLNAICKATTAITIFLRLGHLIITDKHLSLLFACLTNTREFCIEDSIFEGFETPIRINRTHRYNLKSFDIYCSELIQSQLFNIFEGLRANESLVKSLGYVDLSETNVSKEDAQMIMIDTGFNAKIIK